MRRLLLAILCLGVPVAAQIPVPMPPPPPIPAAAGIQAPARDNKLQLPIGTGLIEGTVVAIDTGRGLNAARVSLNASDVQLSRSVTTDDQGHFSFANLPAGQFNLSASRTRYLSTSFGQKAPDRSGTPIHLNDGQQMKAVTLRLFTGAVITGILTDDRGEPAMNTQVRVLRYVMRNGTRTLQQSGQSQADDRGVYRIHTLMPGDYIVSVEHVNKRNERAVAHLWVHVAE